MASIPVLVNYETTWYRSNHAASALAKANDLGEIRKVVIHDGHRGPKEIGVQPEFLAWLTDPARNGAGALFDFGCYGANLMTWLMDEARPATVTAVTQQIKPEVYPKVDDEATIILQYPAAQAIIQASWNWPFDRKDLEIYGRTGQALTLGQDAIKVRLGGKPEETRQAPPLPPPLDDFLRYFAAVVRKRDPARRPVLPSQQPDRRRDPRRRPPLRHHRPDGPAGLNPGPAGSMACLLRSARTGRDRGRQISPPTG